jgi:hypothetical protein
MSPRLGKRCRADCNGIQPSVIHCGNTVVNEASTIAFLWTNWLTAVSVTRRVALWGCVHGGNRTKFGRIRSGPRLCMAPNAPGGTRWPVDRYCNAGGLGCIDRLGLTSALTVLYGNRANRCPLRRPSASQTTVPAGEASAHWVIRGCMSLKALTSRSSEAPSIAEIRGTKRLARPDQAAAR